MVKLRLTRIGATHAPFYRIIAIDSRKARDAKNIEVIGNYDPTKNPKVVNINVERAKYWLSVGAMPTDTVRALLKKYGKIEMAPKIFKKVKPGQEKVKTEKNSKKADKPAKAEVKAEVKADAAKK